MKKITLSVVLFFIITVFVLDFATHLLMPKYTGKSREGNLISEYYADADEKIGHQVIFVGDCEVFESFVPPILWCDFGITSYVRGSPAQTVWQSYYLLCEMLQYETPDAVVFNVYAMMHAEGVSEAYNRMMLDGMRWSEHKLGAINASVTDSESYISYVFPLLRFHSRWRELSVEDIEYAYSRPTVSHNGYLMKKGIVAQSDDYTATDNADVPLSERCFEYLDKIRVLCENSGVELILVKSPTDSWRYPWYDEWDTQISDFAEKNGICYYNFIENADIGLDMTQDTYDGGAHLNVFGAEKLTAYFGAILQSKHGISDMRGDGELCRVWNEKLDKYETEKEKE